MADSSLYSSKYIVCALAPYFVPMPISLLHLFCMLFDVVEQKNKSYPTSNGNERNL